MRPGYWIKVMAVWRGLERRLIYVTLLTLLIALFQAMTGCLMSTSISKKSVALHSPYLFNALSHTHSFTLYSMASNVLTSVDWPQTSPLRERGLVAVVWSFSSFLCGYGYICVVKDYGAHKFKVKVPTSVHLGILYISSKTWIAMHLIILTIIHIRPCQIKNAYLCWAILKLTRKSAILWIKLECRNSHTSFDLVMHLLDGLGPSHAACFA